MVTRIGTPYVREHLKIAIFEMQHAGWPPSWQIEKSPYLSNGSTDLDKTWQWCRFGVPAYQPLRIWILQIQDGVGRHFKKPLNHDIFAAVWQISIQLRTVTHMGTPDRTKP